MFGKARKEHQMCMMRLDCTCMGFRIFLGVLGSLGVTGLGP